MLLLYFADLLFYLNVILKTDQQKYIFLLKNMICPNEKQGFFAII